MQDVDYKATFSAWYKTHGRKHKEYQRRKRYPWHLIGNVVFDKDLINKEQTLINSAGKVLGTACIFEYQEIISDDRIVFEFWVKSASQANDFRVVFLTTGLLITIFALGIDSEKESIDQFLLGEQSEIFTKKIARLILLEFVWRKLKGNMGYEVQRSFVRIANQNNALDLKECFIVDISHERKLWFFVSLFEYEAVSKARKYSSQCEQIISIFLISNALVQSGNPGIAYTSIHILDYLENRITQKENVILSKLACDSWGYDNSIYYLNGNDGIF